MHKKDQLTTQCLALAIASGFSLASASGAEAPKADAAATAKPAAAPTQPAAAQPAPVSDTEKWIQESKKPVSWFKWGADLRLRHEYVNNAGTVGNGDVAYHEQSYSRFRGRVWASFMPTKDLDLNVRLNSEPREYFKRKAAGGPTGLDWTQGIFDGLNLQWRNIGDVPLTLTLGRQDMMEAGRPIFGDGFLIMDGTPLDGSRTFFLDAARLKYDWKETKTVFHAMYIDQYASDNAWMPTLNALDNQWLTEQHERGAVFYVTHQFCPAAQLDGYFIYKHDDHNLPSGDDADIYTPGLRLSGDIQEHVRYRVEGAYQFGKKDSLDGNGEKDISAYGINSCLSYLFKDPMNNQVRFSYELLSGDDAATKGRNEGFDVLWARWPRWSEAYVFSYANEVGKPSQITNLQRLGPGWSVSPFKKADFSLDYYLLLAMENVPKPAFYGSGKDRGQMLQAIFKYKFNQHVSGLVHSEFIFPGDFYKYNDMMTFVRAEINLTY